MSVHVEDINTEAVIDSVISSLRTLDCALGDLKESGLVKGGGVDEDQVKEIVLEVLAECRTSPETEKADVHPAFRKQKEGVKL